MADRPLPQTPSQTVGPFFHDALVRGGENVLVAGGTKGQRILVTGRVLDGDGEGVPDALLEIWQPDARGIFAHPADPHFKDADPHFRGFGRADTVRGGRYTFETVKPGVPAWGREGGLAPSINVRVFARGLLIHAPTRLYFSDEAEANLTDPVLKGVPPDRRGTLIARLEATPGLPTYRFDVRLQGEGETVFFDP